MQAHLDITLHVGHFAMKIARNPLCVMTVMRIEFYVGDSNLLKSQLAPNLFYDS